MTALEKLRYVGLRQTIRKFRLKAERSRKSRKLETPYLPPADRTLELKLDLLGQTFDLSSPNRWHLSPETGNCWPLMYSQAIPLNAAGDVKLIWELNRHQFLPALAKTDPDLVRRILQDWVRQNPCEFGVNWISALEVGLRLIAWLETFEAAPELLMDFAKAVEQHVAFVRHNLSADWIPRGNHLIGEATALAVYEHGRTNEWLTRAAAEQFFPSGVHREQAVAYHHFVTHLFSLARMPQPKALAYLAAIRQPDGSLPNIGDSDDGRASSHPLLLPEAPKTSVAFPDAGHFVLRREDDYCFVRCGEFGLGPNYAHAHADLLSPILWLRGVPVLVDTGTFTYNGEAALRQYFRSAQAHNVVTFDGQDFAVQNGTFSWQKPPKAVCESHDERTVVGRMGPWRRSIQLVNDGCRIVDTIDGAERKLNWRFQLAPGLRVERVAEKTFEISGKLGLRVEAPAGGQLRVADGWQSPSYNRRVPIQVCEISLDATAPVTAEFRIQ